MTTTTTLLGTRTLCQYPGCGHPIEELVAVPGAWVHVGGRMARPAHEATPVEQLEPPVLPAEAFTDPARLVDLLADSAEHHGWTVDRSEHTLSTLLHVARTLVQILIPADPEPSTAAERKPYCWDCKDDPEWPDHGACGDPECGCVCNDEGGAR